MAGDRRAPMQGPEGSLCGAGIGFAPSGQTQVVSPSLGLLGLGPKVPNPTDPEPRQTCGDYP